MSLHSGVNLDGRRTPHAVGVGIVGTYIREAPFFVSCLVLRGISKRRLRIARVCEKHVECRGVAPT